MEAKIRKIRYGNEIFNKLILNFLKKINKKNIYNKYFVIVDKYQLSQ